MFVRFQTDEKCVCSNVGRLDDTTEWRFKCIVSYSIVKILNSIKKWYLVQIEKRKGKEELAGEKWRDVVLARAQK